MTRTMVNITGDAAIALVINEQQTRREEAAKAES
jgi:Na+/H+-dicarboxylate symporter